MRLPLRSAMICAIAVAAPASAVNLLKNGSFEGPTGIPPVSWSVGGIASDNYIPVAIQYNQASNYPFGAQGEVVPVDNAPSLSPDAAGTNGVYFVSDEAKDLSLYQSVYLTPGSYDIGFDSYDTRNGNDQPHDAYFTANIAGVQLASFDLASVSPGHWSSYLGKANVLTAGSYLVSFTFNTPDTPANPNPLNPGGEYNAKDVVIDRAYIIADQGGGGISIPSGVPEPASWGLMVGGFGFVGGALRRRRHRTILSLG